MSGGVTLKLFLCISGTGVSVLRASGLHAEKECGVAVLVGEQLPFGGMACRAKCGPVCVITGARRMYRRKQRSPEGGEAFAWCHTRVHRAQAHSCFLLLVGLSTHALA